MLRVAGLVLFSLLLAFAAKADFWELPTCKTYYSVDSSTSIYVMPACITTVKKRKAKNADTCSGRCLKERPPLAVVYRHSNHKKNIACSFELVNVYVPHQVFISNNGVYVITIDNWGGTGIGEYVMVIYKHSKLIKHYSLAEISPIPIIDYRRTVSSIRWFSQLEFIDNNMLKVSFEDKDENITDKYFDLEDIR